LAPSFPSSELRYILDHSGALVLLSSAKYAAQAKEVLKEGLENTPLFAQVDKLEKGSDESFDVELVGQIDSAAGGMMLFTSGTTARPKGVVLSQATLTAQAHSLLEAWEYTPADRLLHVLPLHHIHGTVNALLTPLLAGSSIEFMFPFNVDKVWQRFTAPFLQSNGAENPSNGTTHDTKPPITFFTVVPTIWARMLQTYPALSPDMKEATNTAISRKNLRLNISGSAALPKPTRDGWTDLSNGNVLLERRHRPHRRLRRLASSLSRGPPSRNRRRIRLHHHHPTWLRNRPKHRQRTPGRNPTTRPNNLLRILAQPDRDSKRIHLRRLVQNRRHRRPPPRPRRRAR
jgi:malonyl-CoA/methylmalonyl-CoA synthetase